MTRHVLVAALLLTLAIVGCAQKPTQPSSEEPRSQAEGSQDLHGLYRIRKADSETHVEYHKVTVPKGKEVVLADLKGPGKVTYWYVTDNTAGK